MNDITWLSHGGPGSGRYPKGFKLLKTKLAERRARKELNNYINSDYFLRGDRIGYDNRDVNSLVVPKSNSINEYNGPNWTYGKRQPNVTFKTKLKSESDSIKNKKKYESPDLKKNINQKNTTNEETTKTSSTESKEKEKLSSADLASAAGKFKGAGAMTKEISSGVDKAWNSLHNVKYANEDRSKNVRGLTNDELRKTIERIKLDQEYNKITMPPKSKGYDRTMAALAVLGSVATVTATGLSIASGVKQLKRS